MGNWSLVAYLGVGVIGALAFLRLVANEIAGVEREAEYLRKSELSKKRPTVEEEVVVAQVA